MSLGVYSPVRSNLPDEAKFFSQSVALFVKKYSEASPAIKGSPSRSISSSLWTPIDRMLAEVDGLNIRKKNILKRCHLVDPKDRKLIESSLGKAQEKIDQILCRFHTECLSPNRHKKIADRSSFDFSLLCAEKFQTQYNDLENETAEFLASPTLFEKGVELQGRWLNFIEDIRVLNGKAGKFLFTNMKDFRINADRLGILNAEQSRIELWIKADQQLLLLRDFFSK